MSLVQKTYDNAKLEPYQNPDSAETESVPFVASQTLAKGTVVGMVTASKKYKTYANGNSDGSEVAVGILQYDITVDSNGKVAFKDEKGTLFDSAPIYIKGEFLQSELTGLDAAAIVDLGRVANGVLLMS